MGMGWNGVGREKLTMNSIQSPLLILRIQIPNRLPHNQPQFDFIVQYDSLGTKDWARARNKDGGGRLQEEEGLFWFDVVEFCDVVSV